MGAIDEANVPPGRYMFPQYAGQWIPDTPARRRAILARLSTWSPMSNSSPVEGIEALVHHVADELGHARQIDIGLQRR